jgi:hypothetical protein
VNHSAIESLATEVARAYRLELPVDLERIASEEGIELAPGNYPPDFHGRLEYVADEGAFIIFYPHPRPGLPEGRVRFSVGHELGHYFIEEHRELIISGRVHNSVESFKPAKDRIEREADQFASALLIPQDAFYKFRGRRAELPLSALIELSERAKTSIQATLFRYTSLADEACLAIVSKNGRVIRSFPSGLAHERGFGGLGQEAVPIGSSAVKCLKAAPLSLTEQSSDTSHWFSERRFGGTLWEESMRIGQDYAVTMLSWPEDKF